MLFEVLKSLISNSSHNPEDYRAKVNIFYATGDLSKDEYAQLVAMLNSTSR